LPIGRSLASNPTSPSSSWVGRPAGCVQSPAHAVKIGWEWQFVGDSDDRRADIGCINTAAHWVDDHCGYLIVG